tara:strand:- start:718 stop:1050 length:333 start_codon:yes stop_codon:yes gene_type:complete
MSGLSLLLSGTIPDYDDKNNKDSNKCLTFGIGIVAAVITASILIPQVVVTYRDKVPYYGLTTMVYTLSIASKLLWITYGARKKDNVIIGGAVFEMVIVGLLILSQIIFKN